MDAEVHKMELVSTKDRLPEEEGLYLTYARGYEPVYALRYWVDFPGIPEERE